MHFHNSQGIIVFDPVPLTGSVDKMFKPGWMLLSVRCDIDKYYRWFLRKRYGIELMMPAWGPHISVIRGEGINGEGNNLDKELWQSFKDKYNGQKVDFFHEVEPRTNGKHWWLRVECEYLKNIRHEMGLDKEGKFNLHLTLGMPHPLHLDHSYYIWKLYRNKLLNI